MDVFNARSHGDSAIMIELTYIVTILIIAQEVLFMFCSFL